MYSIFSQELLGGELDNVSGISAGEIVLDFDRETWSENADSARIFLSKYKDEIAETRRELQTATSQAERRKIETLKKVLRNPCCMQAIFELPGCSIMYRDGEWGFYKPPKVPQPPQPPQPELKSNLQESAFMKGLTSFHKMFVGFGNDLTQTFADLVDSIPLSMDEMLEEAPIHPQSADQRGGLRTISEPLSAASHHQRPSPRKEFPFLQKSSG